MPLLRDADGAELDALQPLAFMPSRHQLQDLIRLRIGREVVIPVLTPEQRVAHAAADEIELVADCSESFGEIVHECGQLQQVAQARVRLRRGPTHRPRRIVGASAKGR